jgi:hypothetical protein
MRQLVIVASVVGLAVPCHAFELNGLRSGMPIADALKVAEQLGFAYGEAKEGTPYTRYWTYASTNGGPTLGFLQDKFCLFGHYGAGDLHQFTQLASERMSVMGAPTYAIHHEIMGNGKIFSEIAAKWQTGSDYAHVIITQVGSGSEAISLQLRDTALCPAE